MTLGSQLDFAGLIKSAENVIPKHNNVLDLNSKNRLCEKWNSGSTGCGLNELNLVCFCCIIVTQTRRSLFCCIPVFLTTHVTFCDSFMLNLLVMCVESSRGRLEQTLMVHSVFYCFWNACTVCGGKEPYGSSFWWITLRAITQVIIKVIKSPTKGTVTIPSGTFPVALIIICWRHKLPSGGQ